MKPTDIVVTVGAIGAVAAIGYFGYNYYLSTQNGEKKKEEEKKEGEIPQTAEIPGAPEKFTVLPGGGLTPALPSEITTQPCPAGYYKSVQDAQKAFMLAHSGQTIDGTWNFSWMPDRTECVTINYVVTKTGKVT